MSFLYINSCAIYHKGQFNIINDENMLVTVGTKFVSDLTGSSPWLFLGQFFSITHPPLVAIVGKFVNRYKTRVLSVKRPKIRKIVRNFISN